MNFHFLQGASLGHQNSTVLILSPTDFSQITSSSVKLGGRSPASLKSLGKTNPAFCSFVREVFWPSLLTVRAASRSNPKLRPMRSRRRENPIDKNSLRSPRVGSAFGLLSRPGSRSRALSLGAPVSRAPCARRPRPGFSLPALSYRPFPRSTRLSWAQSPRPLRAGGRGGSPGRTPQPGCCLFGGRPPPWPLGWRGPAAQRPRSRHSGKQGAWWGSWPWRRQLLPLR